MLLKWLMVRRRHKRPVLVTVGHRLEFWIVRSDHDLLGAALFSDHRVRVHHLHLRAGYGGCFAALLVLLLLVLLLMVTVLLNRLSLWLATIFSLICGEYHVLVYLLLHKVHLLNQHLILPLSYLKLRPRPISILRLLQHFIIKLVHLQWQVFILFEQFLRYDAVLVDLGNAFAGLVWCLSTTRPTSLTSIRRVLPLLLLVDKFGAQLWNNAI